MITRCNNTKRELEGLSKCYDDKTIDEYIRTLQIDHWVIEEKFDFDQYDREKPIFLNQRLVSSDLLDPVLTKNKIVSLRMNNIKLRDQIF